MSGYKRYTIRVDKNNGQNLKVNKNGKLEYICLWFNSLKCQLSPPPNPQGGAG